MSVTIAGNILVQSNGQAIPISLGGTGQTTAPTAINALLPTQTGNAGKVLITDGTNISWASGGGAAAAGSDTQIQFNDSGNFGATANLTVNKSSGALTSASSMTAQSLNITNAVTTYRTLSYQTSGSNRWLMQANNSAENGTGLGSNFEFVRVADNGSTQNIVYSVARNSGVVDFKVTPTVNGSPVGTGTVTSVSVTTANGVSGSVATATTTPAITLSLGAITPTSVVSTGALTGTAISGTSLSLTSTLSVGGDSGTSGYILVSGGPSASPTWALNTGSTSLSATGAFPSIAGTTGVYAGVTSGTPRLDIYNFSAPSGDRLQYFEVNSDGGTSIGLTDSVGYDQDWLTISRSGAQATVLAFTGTSTTFSGTVSGTSFTGAHIGNGSSLTSLNASNLTSGTLGISRLGASGTPSTTTFLRGDNIWATPAGTVSSVSVTTANGVSGTVATSTTTPAITLTLGAITPSSVAATGAVSGTSLSAGSATGTITGRLNTRSANVTGVTTVTPTSDSVDVYYATSQAANFTVAAPTGTPALGQKLLIVLQDNGTSRTISWNAIYRVIGTSLPAATVAGKFVYVGCIWNSIGGSFWDVIGVAQQ